MDEKQISQLINNLDNDLFCQELDSMMDGIEIDMDSIAEKARWKLRKEQHKLHKRKLLPIIAASLVLICGVTTVYAADISAFIKSLLNKTGVYSTVVDGSAYYLESPVALDGSRSLSHVMFTADSLELQFRPGWDSPPDLKIKINGEEIEPHGFGGDSIGFYSLTPTDKFDLILNGKSYPITLISSRAVTDGGEIIEAEPNDIKWVSMGYKKINGGVQILTAFDDRDLQLRSLVIPQKDTVTESFDKTGSHSYREEFMPLLGYDQDGNSYEYNYDVYDMGRPLTKFTSNAPADKKITLKIPGIVVSCEKNFADVNVPLPATGEKQEVNQEIDLSLQKMVLQSIERTSATTAKLIFKLNTGNQSNVKIWSANIDSKAADSGTLLWENGTCTMDITFAEGTTQMNLQISAPNFIVDGDWVLQIE